MSIRGDGITIGTLKQWLARLLLLAVVARALIPIGYMPDFSAAADGIFKIVICSAMGGKSVALDGDGKPLPDQRASHDDQPCVFAGLAVAALPALDTTPFVPAESGASTLTAPLAVQLPPPRAGPTLGSRGPPQIS